MFKHVLIPTDGSPVAAKAIQAGVALATEMGAERCVAIMADALENSGAGVPLGQVGLAICKNRYRAVGEDLLRLAAQQLGIACGVIALRSGKL